MTVEDQIRDEKLQYDINREAAKVSALSSDEIDTYEEILRSGEEILRSDQHQMKNKQKQIKTIKDQGEKQVNALESLKLKEVKPEETKPIVYDNYFILMDLLK